MGRFHLARYVGAGSDIDPFRPAGAEQAEGWSAIDLRPDPATADGFALLWTPTSLPTSAQRVVLTDDPDDASTTLRDRLANRLGINLDADRFRRLVLRLLLAGDDDNPNRWNRLRPAGPQWEVWLGGLLHTMPVVAGGSIGAESFNKANSSTLGPDLTWTELQTDMTIVSNAVEAIPTASTTTARADADVSSVDHEASCDVLALTATLNNIAVVCCRMPSTATVTGYGLRRFHDGTNYAHRLEKVVAGTTTVLAGPTTLARSGTENIKVDASGSTIKGYVDSVQKHSVTDTAITTGTRGGIRIFRASATQADIRLDNFRIADLVATPTHRFFAVL